MCAPSETSAESSTGIFDAVASTMMCAPRAASEADAAARIGSAGVECSRANASQCARVGLQTRTSASAATCRSASRWLRACTPLPMIASVFASRRARSLADTADTAAVRASVM